ncbi:hypothetical protein ACFYUR_12450 [Micromonospora haikouensis]|uniref:hypothetical protein n=1 Tax=Micromonospora haikouensis TaxID=686309 RepID=UPI0036AEFB14
MTATHEHTCTEVGRLAGEIESLTRANLAYAAENADLRAKLAQAETELARYRQGVDVMARKLRHAGAVDA